MKTRTAGRLLGAAALVLALSACEGTVTVQSEGSSSSSSPAPSGAPSTTSTPANTMQPPGSTTQAEPTVQDPGDPPVAEPPLADPPPPVAPVVDYVPKSIGEEAYIVTSDGSRAVTFTLEDVVVDPVCTSASASPAQNGHLVRLDLDLSTADSVTMEQVLGWNSYTMGSYGWVFIDKDGYSANATTSSASVNCQEGASEIYGIGPDEHVASSIVLDIPSTSGTLRYMDPTIGQGWEWQIG